MCSGAIGRSAVQKDFHVESSTGRFLDGGNSSQLLIMKAGASMRYLCVFAF